MKLSVRELLKSDIPQIVNYFVDANHDFLRGMGADPVKLPSKKAWNEIIETDFDKPNNGKSFYYIIWEIDGKAIGHCNINKIKFGDQAFMHLHLWGNGERKQGMGTEFLRKTIPHFFEKFELKTLLCEPFAYNPAPNRTLLKLGFEFVKTYETTPGWINLLQDVSRYQMSKERFFCIVEIKYLRMFFPKHHCKWYLERSRKVLP